MEYKCSYKYIYTNTKFLHGERWAWLLEGAYNINWKTQNVKRKLIYLLYVNKKMTCCTYSGSSDLNLLYII